MRPRARRGCCGRRRPGSRAASARARWQRSATARTAGQRRRRTAARRPRSTECARPPCPGDALPPRTRAAQRGRRATRRNRGWGRRRTRGGTRRAARAICWRVRPVLFHLWSYAVPTHDFFVLLGVLAGLLVFLAEARRRDMVDERILWIVVGALLCGAVALRCHRARADAARLPGRWRPQHPRRARGRIRRRGPHQAAGGVSRADGRPVRTRRRAGDGGGPLGLLLHRAPRHADPARLGGHVLRRRAASPVLPL